MTQTGTGRTASSGGDTDTSGAGPYSRGGPGTGWLWFAAVMLFIVGCHNLIYGIAALDNYVVLVNNLAVNDLAGDEVNIIYADTTFWGWLWVSVGIVQILTAIAVPSRNQAARWFAVALAAINAIGQLAFLAAFPVWSVIIIAIDILIIYGLLTWDTPRRSAYAPYPGDVPATADQPGGGGYYDRATTASGRPGGASTEPQTTRSGAAGGMPTGTRGE